MRVNSDVEIFINSAPKKPSHSERNAEHKLRGRAARVPDCPIRPTAQANKAEKYSLLARHGRRTIENMVVDIQGCRK